MMREMNRFVLAHGSDKRAERSIDFVLQKAGAGGSAALRGLRFVEKYDIDTSIRQQMANEYTGDTATDHGDFASHIALSCGILWALVAHRTPERNARMQIHNGKLLRR